MNKTFLHRILPLVGVAILGILIYKIGLGAAIRAFSELDPKVLLMLPPLIAMSVTVQTLKWHMILRHQDVAVPFGLLFKLNLAGIFYGAITPGRAGVLVKARLLADYSSNPLSQLGASVVIDKLLELMVLAGFASVGSVIVARMYGPKVFVAALVMLALLAALSLVLFRKGAGESILKLMFSGGASAGRVASFKRVLDNFYAGVPGRAAFIVVPLALTVCVWLMLWTQTFIVSRALAIDVPYGTFIVIVAVAALISLIPITVNGIGTRDASLVAMLAVFGVAPEQALAMSLVGMLINGYGPAVVGAYHARRLGKATGNPTTEPNAT
jgi:glycosyltransferase 2 family protein